MRLFTFLLLFISNYSFSQQLVLSIDSITYTNNEVNERVFKVNYHLKNTTNDTLYFFLDPKNISPSTGGSLTKEIYYKIYENDKFIEIGKAFNQFFAEVVDFNFDENMTQVQRDSVAIVFMAKKLEEDPARLLKIYKDEGALALMDPSRDYMQKISKRVNNYYHTLQPNQMQNFEATFIWNKIRYYYMEPNEFYLDENEKHYFELTFVALKEEYKSQIDPELYAKIVDDPNFIKGVFISNKVEINLKPD